MSLYRDLASLCTENLTNEQANTKIRQLIQTKYNIISTPPISNSKYHALGLTNDDVKSDLFLLLSTYKLDRNSFLHIRKCLFLSECPVCYHFYGEALYLSDGSEMSNQKIEKETNSHKLSQIKQQLNTQNIKNSQINDTFVAQPSLIPSSNDNLLTSQHTHISQSHYQNSNVSNSTQSYNSQASTSQSNLSRPERELSVLNRNDMKSFSANQCFTDQAYPSQTKLSQALMSMSNTLIKPNSSIKISFDEIKEEKRIYLSLLGEHNRKDKFNDGMFSHHESRINKLQSNISDRYECQGRQRIEMNRNTASIYNNILLFYISPKYTLFPLDIHTLYPILYLLQFHYAKCYPIIQSILTLKTKNRDIDTLREIVIGFYVLIGVRNQISQYVEGKMCDRKNKNDRTYAEISDNNVDVGDFGLVNLIQLIQISSICQDSAKPIFLRGLGAQVLRKYHLMNTILRYNIKDCDCALFYDNLNRDVHLNGESQSNTSIYAKIDFFVGLWVQRTRRQAQPSASASTNNSFETYLLGDVSSQIRRVPKCTSNCTFYLEICDIACLKNDDIVHFLQQTEECLRLKQKINFIRSLIHYDRLSCTNLPMVLRILRECSKLTPERCIYEDIDQEKVRFLQEYLKLHPLHHQAALVSGNVSVNIAVKNEFEQMVLDNLYSDQSVRRPLLPGNESIYEKFYQNLTIAKQKNSQDEISQLLANPIATLYTLQKYDCSLGAFIYFMGICVRNSVQQPPTKSSHDGFLAHEKNEKGRTQIQFGSDEKQIGLDMNTPDLKGSILSPSNDTNSFKEAHNELTPELFYIFYLFIEKALLRECTRIEKLQKMKCKYTVLEKEQEAPRAFHLNKISKTYNPHDKGCEIVDIFINIVFIKYKMVPWTALDAFLCLIQEYFSYIPSEMLVLHYSPLNILKQNKNGYLGEWAQTIVLWAISRGVIHETKKHHDHHKKLGDEKIIADYQNENTCSFKHLPNDGKTLIRSQSCSAKNNHQSYQNVNLEGNEGKHSLSSSFKKNKNDLSENREIQSRGYQYKRLSLSTHSYLNINTVYKILPLIYDVQPFILSMLNFVAKKNFQEKKWQFHSEQLYFKSIVEEIVSGRLSEGSKNSSNPDSILADPNQLPLNMFVIQSIMQYIPLSLIQIEFRPLVQTFRSSGFRVNSETRITQILRKNKNLGRCKDKNGLYDNAQEKYNIKCNGCVYHPRGIRDWESSLSDFNSSQKTNRLNTKESHFLDLLRDISVLALPCHLTFLFMFYSGEICVELLTDCEIYQGWMATATKEIDCVWYRWFVHKKGEKKLEVSSDTKGNHIDQKSQSTLERNQPDIVYSHSCVENRFINTSILFTYISFFCLNHASDPFERIAIIYDMLECFSLSGFAQSTDLDTNENSPTFDIAFILSQVKKYHKIPETCRNRKDLLDFLIHHLKLCLNAISDLPHLRILRDRYFDKTSIAIDIVGVFSESVENIAYSGIQINDRQKALIQHVAQELQVKIPYDRRSNPQFGSHTDTFQTETHKPCQRILHDSEYEMQKKITTKQTTDQQCDTSIEQEPHDTNHGMGHCKFSDSYNIVSNTKQYQVRYNNQEYNSKRRCPTNEHNQDSHTISKGTTPLSLKDCLYYYQMILPVWPENIHDLYQNIRSIFHTSLKLTNQPETERNDILNTTYVTERNIADTLNCFLGNYHHLMGKRSVQDLYLHWNLVKYSNYDTLRHKSSNEGIYFGISDKNSHDRLLFQDTLVLFSLNCNIFYETQERNNIIRHMIRNGDLRGLFFWGLVNDRFYLKKYITAHHRIFQHLKRDKNSSNHSLIHRKQPIHDFPLKNCAQKKIKNDDKHFSLGKNTMSHGDLRKISDNNIKKHTFDRFNTIHHEIAIESDDTHHDADKKAPNSKITGKTWPFSKYGVVSDTGSNTHCGATIDTESNPDQNTNPYENNTLIDTLTPEFYSTLFENSHYIDTFFDLKLQAILLLTNQDTINDGIEAIQEVIYEHSRIHDSVAAISPSPSTTQYPLQDLLFKSSFENISSNKYFSDCTGLYSLPIVLSTLFLLKARHSNPLVSLIFYIRASYSDILFEECLLRAMELFWERKIVPSTPFDCSLRSEDDSECEGGLFCYRYIPQYKKYLFYNFRDTDCSYELILSDTHSLNKNVSSESDAQPKTRFALSQSQAIPKMMIDEPTTFFGAHFLLLMKYHPSYKVAPFFTQFINKMGNRTNRNRKDDNPKTPRSGGRTSGRKTKQPGASGNILIEQVFFALLRYTVCCDPWYCVYNGYVYCNKGKSSIRLPGNSVVQENYRFKSGEKDSTKECSISDKENWPASHTNRVLGENATRDKEDARYDSNRIRQPHRGIDSTGELKRIKFDKETTTLNSYEPPYEQTVQAVDPCDPLFLYVDFAQIFYTIQSFTQILLLIGKNSQTNITTDEYPELDHFKIPILVTSNSCYGQERSDVMDTSDIFDIVEQKETAAIKDGLKINSSKIHSIFDSNTGHASKTVTSVKIASFNKTINTFKSLQAPKRLIYTDNAGQCRSFMIKCNDELRKDSRMIGMYKLFYRFKEKRDFNRIHTDVYRKCRNIRDSYNENFSIFNKMEEYSSNTTNIAHSENDQNCSSIANGILHSTHKHSVTSHGNHYHSGSDKRIAQSENIQLETHTSPKRMNSNCKKCDQHKTHPIENHHPCKFQEALKCNCNISHSLFDKDENVFDSIREGIDGFLLRHYVVVPLGTKFGMIEWIGNLITVRNIVWNDNKKIICSVWKKYKTKIEHREFLKYENESVSSIKYWFRDQYRNTKEFYRNKYNYLNSLAITSAYGYFLGLGDRHLENINILTDSGTIVHIDLNLLFSKAKQLSVPERVEFRLTKCIVDNLLIGKENGLFRIRFREMIELIRKKVSLIEAHLLSFVYDPINELSRPKQTIASLIKKLDRDSDELIKENMDKRNLSGMYVGWMPFL